MESDIGTAFKGVVLREHWYTNLIHGLSNDARGQPTTACSDISCIIRVYESPIQPTAAARDDSLSWDETSWTNIIFTNTLNLPRILPIFSTTAVAADVELPIHSKSRHD